MEDQANKENNNKPTTPTSDEDIIEFEPQYNFTVPSAEQIANGISQFAQERQQKLFKHIDIREGTIMHVGITNIDELCKIVSSKNYSEYINTLPKQNPKLETMQDILSHYQLDANRTIHIDKITNFWNHRMPPAEPAVSKLINSMVRRGRTDDFRITVVELIPHHYLLLDGAHRICAWKIMCQVNPDLILDCTAQVLASTLTWQQVAIICGCKNDMPTKQHDLLDTIFWFRQFHKQILDIKQIPARLSFVHQACGMDFIVQKRSSTPAKTEESKTAESKELQRLLNLSMLMTDDNFGKITHMWQRQSNEEFKGTRISKSTLHQPPLHELLSICTEAAQNAFGEFLDFIKGSNHALEKSAVEKLAMLLANKHYLMMEIQRSGKMPSPLSDQKMIHVLAQVPIDNWQLIIPEKLENEEIVGQKRTVLMNKNGQMKWMQPTHIKLGILNKFEELFMTPPAFKTLITNTAKVTQPMINAVKEQIYQWTRKTAEQDISVYTKHVIQYIDAMDVPTELLNQTGNVLIDFLNGKCSIDLFQPSSSTTTTITTTKHVDVLSSSTNQQKQATITNAQQEARIIKNPSQTKMQSSSSEKQKSKHKDEKCTDEEREIENQLPKGRWKPEEDIGILWTASKHPRIPFYGDENFMKLCTVDKCAECIGHQILTRMFKVLNLNRPSGTVLKCVQTIQNDHKKRIREYFGENGKDKGEKYFLNEMEGSYNLFDYDDYDPTPQQPPGSPGPQVQSTSLQTETNGENSTDDQNNEKEPSICKEQTKLSDSSSSSEKPEQHETQQKQTEIQKQNMQEIETNNKKQQEKQSPTKLAKKRKATKQNNKLHDNDDDDDDDDAAADQIYFDRDIHVPFLDDHIFKFTLRNPTTIKIPKTTLSWIADEDEDKFWILLDKDNFDEDVQDKSTKLTNVTPPHEQDEIDEEEEKQNNKRKTTQQLTTTTKKHKSTN